MGQSLIKSYNHIVFSTKHRLPFIQPPVEAKLHAYLGSVCNNLEVTPIKIGGYTDHVHILCSLSSKVSLMELVSKVKSNSSRWIKTNGGNYKRFAWQRGYGVFSVSQSHVNRVKKYIENQHEHHKEQDFKKEYLGLLEEYEIEYDIRYLWD